MKSRKGKKDNELSATETTKQDAIKKRETTKRGLKRNAADVSLIPDHQQGPVNQLLQFTDTDSLNRFFSNVDSPTRLIVMIYLTQRKLNFTESRKRIKAASLLNPFASFI